MLNKIHHVAIVVRNLDEALQLYDKLFGAKPSKIETLPNMGIKAALLPMAEGGEIELIEPIDPEAGSAKFLESQGEGIHHMCLEVDDIEQSLATLAEKGFELIDKKSRPGLAGRIGFLSPNATKGARIELIETYEKSH